MAIGWLSVLKMVPWGDVISNAPKVADGAKKLWSAVAKKPSSTELPASRAQLTAAEAAVSDLHHQMLASSELIKALADQNTQLIKRVEANRIRVLWLFAATAVLSVVVALNLLMTLAR